MDDISQILRKNYCTADRISTAPCYKWMQNEGADINKPALLMFCQQVPNDPLCIDVNNHTEQIVNHSPMEGHFETEIFKVFLLVLIFIICGILFYRLFRKSIPNITIT